MFKALEAAGIVRVVVTFDGSGDAGQIEDVAVYGCDNSRQELRDTTIVFRQVEFDAAEPSTKTSRVGEVLEHLAYGLLEQTHDGWENEDGAFGEFAFDVAARSISLEYNERYIDTHYHEHEPTVASVTMPASTSDLWVNDLIRLRSYSENSSAGDAAWKRRASWAFLPFSCFSTGFHSVAVSRRKGSAP